MNVIATKENYRDYNFKAGATIQFDGEEVIGPAGQLSSLKTDITVKTPGTTPVGVVEESEVSPGSGLYGVLRAGGAALPAQGEPGYLFGCLFALASTGQIFINIGNSSACNFRLVELGTSTRTGPGAIPLTERTCLLTTTGADALTLPNGTTPGQRVTVTMVVDGGDGTITPASALGFTTAVLDAVGDSVTFEWTGTAWGVVGQHLVTFT